MIQREVEAAQKISPRVIVLHMQNGSMKNYTYLVIDSGSLRAVIVDPAWEIEKIDRALEDNRATLDAVLLTHSHPDHIHLAFPLAEKYECPVWMSSEEIAASGLQADRLVGIDRSYLTVGQMLIEPILTPGHTLGSTCYLIGENLFTGDVLFAEGCGLCPDTAAAYAMFASLEYLKSRLSLQTRIYPGHSYGRPPGRPMAQLRKENIYLQFSDKESFAAFRLRKGQHIGRMFNFF